MRPCSKWQGHGQRLHDLVLADEMRTAALPWVSQPELLLWRGVSLRQWCCGQDNISALPVVLLCCCHKGAVRHLGTAQKVVHMGFPVCSSGGWPGVRDLGVQELAHLVPTHLVPPLQVRPQWFVRMEPLAQPALEAVASGDVRIVPERFEKVYNRWLENIRVGSPNC